MPEESAHKHTHQESDHVKALTAQLKGLVGDFDPMDAMPQVPAVALCIKCWVSGHAKALIEGSSPTAAKLEGDKAYRLAMPPLLGSENISDFIACAAFGTLVGAITSDESAQLLYAAQAAVTAYLPMLSASNASISSHAKALIEGSSPTAAKLEGDKAYRLAMPPLLGSENISDFIACAAFGTLVGAITSDESARLLYAAQAAVTAQEAFSNIR